MRKKTSILHYLVLGSLTLLMALPPGILAQQPGAAPVFKQEELDQILAPIALYPDSLVSQILMASTYPLEIVQAERFAKQNANLKGDALTKALESQTWDPSVKSLVNFPQVLTMMNEKLDWTQKLGDAFLAQQNRSWIRCRACAPRRKRRAISRRPKSKPSSSSNKSSRSNRRIPRCVRADLQSHGRLRRVGVSCISALLLLSARIRRHVDLCVRRGRRDGGGLGLCLGQCNWHGGDVDIDVNRNTNINSNINRDQAKQNLQNRGQVNQSGQGKWQHDAEHRKGVSYRDQGTAEKFNRASNPQAAQSREAFRGHTDQGRQDPGKGGGQGGLGDRNNAGQPGGADRAKTADRGGTSQLGGGGERDGSRGGAFEGVDRGGSSARSASQRGSASRGSLRRRWRRQIRRRRTRWAAIKNEPGVEQQGIAARRFEENLVLSCDLGAPSVSELFLEDVMRLAHLYDDRAGTIRRTLAYTIAAAFHFGRGILSVCFRGLGRTKKFFLGGGSGEGGDRRGEEQRRQGTARDFWRPSQGLALVGRRRGRQAAARRIHQGLR